MTRVLSHWLQGRRALVVGQGSAIDAAGHTLAAAGAVVTRTADGQELAEIAAAFDGAGTFVDILVHGGTPLPVADSLAIDLPEWRARHSADIDGRFLHAAEFARRRIAAGVGGSVLFLMPSPAVAPGKAAALTAHGALDNLVKSLAVEWARDGVRVNAIASRVVDKFDASEPSARASLGALAAWLVSDYCAYVTGTIIGIDEA